MTDKAQNDILLHNRDRRLSPPWWVLLLLACFSVWQMGVMLYSSTSLSVTPGTPIPVESGDLTLLLSFGYVAGILLSFFLPGSCVALGRVCAALSAGCALAMYFPLPFAAATAVYHLQALLCVAFIGISITVSVTRLTPSANLSYCLFMAILAGFFVPALQNDLYKLSFAAVNTVSLLTNAAVFAALLLIPAGPAPRFVTREDGLPAPRHMRVGVYLLVGLTCLMALFGSGIAERVKNGLALYYLSSGVGALLFLLLWKKRGMNPMRLATLFIIAAGLGFLLAVAASALPALRCVSCLLTGLGLSACTLSEFFACCLFERRPSRLVAPLTVAVAFLAVLMQAAILSALRDSPAAYAAVCGVIAVAGVILYIRLEPHLAYEWSRDETSPPPAPEKEPEPPAAPPPVFASLSRQERILADLIMRGYTVKEISETMGIAVNTQKNYRQNLYSKLGIHSRKELYDLASRGGEQKTSDNRTAPPRV